MRQCISTSKALVTLGRFGLGGFGFFDGDLRPNRRMPPTMCHLFSVRRVSHQRLPL